MTEKEFSKLKRRELLELLLMQTREQKVIEDQLAEKTKRVYELEQSFERLEETLEAKDYLIADMKGYQDEQEGKNAELKRRLDEKDNKNAELQAKLAEKERQVSKLEASLTKRSERREKLEASYKKEQDSMNEKLREDLAQKEDQIRKLKETLAEKDSQIQQLAYILKTRVGTSTARSILSGIMQRREKRKRETSTMMDLYGGSYDLGYGKRGGWDE